MASDFVTVGALQFRTRRGHKARALDMGPGQVLLQCVPDDQPWPQSTSDERVGFAGAAALVVPAAKGVVRVVKKAKEAGVLQDGGARGVVRKLREKFRARPGRVIKLRGLFSVAGCCAKCGGGGR